MSKIVFDVDADELRAGGMSKQDVVFAMKVTAATCKRKNFDYQWPASYEFDKDTFENPASHEEANHIATALTPIGCCGFVFNKSSKKYTFLRYTNVTDYFRLKITNGKFDDKVSLIGMTARRYRAKSVKAQEKNLNIATVLDPQLMDTAKTVQRVGDAIIDTSAGAVLRVGDAIIETSEGAVDNIQNAVDLITQTHENSPANHKNVNKNEKNATNDAVKVNIAMKKSLTVNELDETMRTYVASEVVSNDILVSDVNFDFHFLRFYPCLSGIDSNDTKINAMLSANKAKKANVPTTHINGYQRPMLFMLDVLMSRCYRSEQEAMRFAAPYSFYDSTARYAEYGYGLPMQFQFMEWLIWFMVVFMVVITVPMVLYAVNDDAQTFQKK